MRSNTGVRTTGSSYAEAWGAAQLSPIMSTMFGRRFAANEWLRAVENGLSAVEKRIDRRESRGTGRLYNGLNL